MIEMLNSIKGMKIICKKVIALLDKQQRKKAMPVFASMIILSLLELIGVSVIYPLLTLMMTPNEAENNYFMHIIMILFPRGSFVQYLLILCFFIIAIYIVKNIAAIICLRIQYRYAAKCKRKLATLMFESYLYRAYSYFVNTDTGTIISGINGNTTAVYQILVDIFQIMTDLCSILLIGAFLIKTEWRIAMLSLLVAGGSSVLIVMMLKNRMKVAGRKFVEISAKQFQYSTQAVAGIKEIMVMNKREYFIEQFDDNAVLVEDITVQNRFLNACPDRILEATFISGFMLILAVAVISGTDVTALIPVVGTFAMGAFRLMPSASKISSRFNDIVYEQKGLDNCYNNIIEARRLNNERSWQIENTEVVINNWDLLSIRDVSWSYDNCNWVLDGINLDIKKGESIAIIGSSGAGKSTLIDIVLGLYQPQRGGIYIDSVNLNVYGRERAKIIGFVPQTIFLLNDTVRRNVAFGIKDEEIEEKKVIDALEKAQLRSFVEHLPDGLDTVIGDRGIKFSGGQRQRLAIARALYEDPQILILDEATSALDNETETAIMEEIDSLHGHKTLLIVAHRLSTVRNCDRYYEIMNGEVIEKQKDEVYPIEKMVQ